MEEILEQVKTYDIDTLRVKLAENGVPVGPIAPNCISLFQKRLAKELFRRQGGVLDEHQSDEKDSKKAFESLKDDTKETVVSSSAPGVYYAVCLPENMEQEPEVNELVFSDKDLALKTAKKYTGSRFKVFKSEQDAKVFSRLTAESAFQSPRRPSKEDTPVKEPQVASESSPFKAPKPQDLARLRKVIEAGDVDAFKAQVWENPRYLVGSGDTPAMYQEGPRYTAMHIAAIKNKPEMCQTILDILENPEFVNKLYSQSTQSEETQNSRINFLVDLYLNMPDKGNCDSPLHMACKFGHEKVVEVLASHPRIDKVLKNKWGETPKQLICTRAQGSLPAVKKKIEDLLQDQCYVPLMRSDDNTVPAVIGYPWSPDVSKSADMPRVQNSPRDPSMSVKACAGPMSPSDAGLFHKRWTTQPSVSQSPEQAKAYFNTKRSDLEKGMERIGRQLAHDLHIPWSEYWEFLDQFIDISTSNGLDMFEYYLKKRVWLSFVRDFKEKYVLDDQAIDISAISTPVTNRFRQMTVGNTDKSFNSVFASTSDEKKKISSNESEVPVSETRKEESLLCDGEDKEKHKSVHDVLSPMSALSNCFSALKIKDESWSEKATLDSSEVTNDDVVGNSNNKVDNIASSSSKDTVEKDLDIGKDNIDRSIENSAEIDPDIVKTTTKGEKGINKTDLSVKGNVEESLEEGRKIENFENTYEDGRKLENVEIEKSDVVVKRRLISEGSESTASFETAAEDMSDGNHTFCSQLSEPGTFHVVLNIKDSAIIVNIRDYLKASDNHQVGKGICPSANFVVQVKDSKRDIGMKGNIVSLPEIETVQKLLLLEDIEVDSCEGDISQVQDGEVIELGASDKDQNGNQNIQAYLSRAVTLPKTKYIYGPQPTREDLNVSRALSDVTISPELHPNVFHWKINLSRFLRDTNYRWQSPAKLQSKLHQGSPQPSPRGKTSPVIPYRSSLTFRGPQDNVITSNIRTKLFPSKTE